MFYFVFIKRNKCNINLFVYRVVNNHSIRTMVHSRYEYRKVADFRISYEPLRALDIRTQVKYEY